MYLFIGLYTLYGVVVGLGESVQLLVGDESTAPAFLLTTLSVLSWAPQLAVLVSPVVEAVHVPYVGLRKTWVVGAQYGMGAVMLLMLPISWSVSSDVDLPLTTTTAAMLAIALGILHTLAAAHEIATDAWGSSYVHHK